MNQPAPVGLKSNSLTIAITIYVIWVLCFSYFSYKVNEENLYHHVDEQLLTAAVATPMFLPPYFHHENMVASQVSREQSIAYTHLLSHYTKQLDISYIYTLVKQGGDIYFTSSSATEEELATGNGLTTYFDVYDTADPRLYSAFDSEQPLFIEYSDEWGHFRSVFISEKAPDGSIYLVGADITISHINKLLNKTLVQTIFISLLFLLFVYPLYRVMTRNISKEAKRLEQQVDIQTKELRESSERLTLALKTSKQGWCDIDLINEAVTINDQFLGKGTSDSDVSRFSIHHWFEQVHPDDQSYFTKELNKSIATNDFHELDYRRRLADGSYSWFQITGQVVEWTHNDTPSRFVGVDTSITERKQNEQVLRTLAEYGSISNTDIFNKIVMEISQSLHVKYALIGKLDGSHDSVETIAVWSKDHIAENFTYALHGTPCQHVIDQETCFYPNDVQSLFPDDHMLQTMGVVSYLGVPLRNKYGERVGLIAILDDKVMGEQFKTEMLLKSLSVRATIELERITSEQQLHLSTRVFESANEGITITDPQGTIIDANPAFLATTGYEKQDVIGKNNSAFSSGKHSAEFYSEMWDSLLNSGHWQGEIWNKKKNGEDHAQLLNISAITNEHDQVTNYIGLFTDITILKQQQASLELIAHYDDLTGLPNRTLFADRFEDAVKYSKQTNTMLAVCFLDLDEFKSINDLYGHDIGDKLLISVANRLKSTLFQGDTVCRLGGDEFALLLRNISSVKHCKQTITRILKSITTAFRIQGHVIKRTASCGITLYPEDSADLDTLMRHADQAMYQAKLTGRNQFMLFSADEYLQTSEKHLQLKTISKGLDCDEFVLHYQPKVNMKTGQVFGVEALIRWQHPTRGLLFPDDFLPIISGSILEMKLGEWVIKKGLKQLADWKSKNIELELSINISSAHLQEPAFIKSLKDSLEKQPTINPNYLQLEILESSALGDITTVSNTIKQCQNTLGVSFALDDFGTGYSSLTHLRNLAVNTIKIDSSFVRDVLDDPDDFAIIEGTIGLTSVFNRDVIAEGVESTEHGLMLLTMGCHQFQGYGIAKPMPAADVSTWLENYTVNPIWAAYVEEKHSQKEILLTQFQLVSESWLNLLQSSNQTDSLPILDPEKCHHSIWLNRLRNEHYLDEETLQHIDQLHNKLHHLADEVVACSGQANSPEYIELLKSARAASHALLECKVNQ